LSIVVPVASSWKFWFEEGESQKPVEKRESLVPMRAV
jgi:hypothetical protein